MWLQNLSPGIDQQLSYCLFTHILVFIPLIRRDYCVKNFTRALSGLNTGCQLQLQAQNQQLTLEQHQLVQQIQTQQRFLQQFQQSGKFRNGIGLNFTRILQTDTTTQQSAQTNCSQLLDTLLHLQQQQAANTNSLWDQKLPPTTDATLAASSFATLFSNSSSSQAAAQALALQALATRFGSVGGG